jgi:DNA-binding PadR family transcriptional regulator
MSGSEIMNEIEKRTSGHWKPSPGSIYPLLAWFQDNGFTRELPTEEDGMKRYKLTDKGKMLLEEQKKMKKRFGREARWDPPFLEALWLHIPPEKSVKLQESLKRLFVAFLNLRSSLEENPSDQIIEKIQNIIDESTEKIEDLNEKLEKHG